MCKSFKVIGQSGGVLPLKCTLTDWNLLYSKHKSSVTAKFVVNQWFEVQDLTAAKTTMFTFTFLFSHLPAKPLSCLFTGCTEIKLMNVTASWPLDTCGWRISVWWVLTWQTQHCLELAALDWAQRGGGTAHPQAFKLPLTGSDRLHLTPCLPHFRRRTAGLQTPGHHAHNQTDNLQAHCHAAHTWKYSRRSTTSSETKQTAAQSVSSNSPSLHKANTQNHDQCNFLWGESSQFCSGSLKTSLYSLICFISLWLHANSESG